MKLSEVFHDYIKLPSNFRYPEKQFVVFKNPNKEEIKEVFLENKQWKAVRAILYNKDLYIWNAFAKEHLGVSNSLKFDYSKTIPLIINFDNNYNVTYIGFSVVLYDTIYSAHIIDDKVDDDLIEKVKNNKNVKSIVSTKTRFKKQLYGSI